MSTLTTVRDRTRWKSFTFFDFIIAAVSMCLLFGLRWKYTWPELDLWKFMLAAVLCTVPMGIVFHVLSGFDTGFNHALGLSNAVA